MQQGAELLVLRGSSNILTNVRSRFVAEVTNAHAAVCAALADSGCRILDEKQRELIEMKQLIESSNAFAWPAEDAEALEIMRNHE